ncbi:hypothetical protein [Streptomyces axinellae]|uniref:Uncharacterized protein n=1 Tax=Streptomyces axinellae TaxID=552788 RepID=A0ABN3QWL8_9ACTN
MEDKDFDDYCKIFIKKDSTIAVMDMVSALTGGSFERRTMDLPHMVIDVLSNPDKGLQEDFVAWPVIIEVEKPGATRWDDYLEGVRAMLIYFWESETPAVAACDFEDELPWNGGISRIAK